MTEVRTTSSTGGEKGMKPARFDLLPTRPLWAVAEVYGKGAEKYAARNWERGYEWSKSYAALQRHINQFWSGEDIDEDGLPHLAHAVFHCFAMLEWAATHPEFDDRPASVERREAEEERMSDVLQALQDYHNRDGDRPDTDDATSYADEVVRLEVELARKEEELVKLRWELDQEQKHARDEYLRGYRDGSRFHHPFRPHPAPSPTIWRVPERPTFTVNAAGTCTRT